MSEGGGEGSRAACGSERDGPEIDQRHSTSFFAPALSAVSEHRLRPSPTDPMTQWSIEAVRNLVTLGKVVVD